jgi:hypothetical protein
MALSSSWRKIPITLTDSQKGEGKAQACANAWLRQLSAKSARLEENASFDLITNSNSILGLNELHG